MKTYYKLHSPYAAVENTKESRCTAPRRQQEEMLDAICERFLSSQEEEHIKKEVTSL